jgi:hypothetical protein
MQKLLGPMEILRCEEWHTRAPPGIRQQTIKNRQVILSYSKDMLTELHGGPSGYLGINKTLDKAWQRYY